MTSVDGIVRRVFFFFAAGRARLPLTAVTWRHPLSVTSPHHILPDQKMLRRFTVQWISCGLWIFPILQSRDPVVHARIFCRISSAVKYKAEWQLLWHNVQLTSHSHWAQGADGDDKEIRVCCDYQYYDILFIYLFVCFLIDDGIPACFVTVSLSPWYRVNSISVLAVRQASK